MSTLTSRERILRTIRREEVDRIPIADKPWGQDTVERWIEDGMPADVDYQDYFGLDKMIRFDIDNSPRFKEQVLEETDEYKIYTTCWGETRKSFKHMTTTPQSLDFRIKSPDDWAIAKERMTPDRERIQWDHLAAHWKTWQDDGAFIMPSIYVGFDITHSYMTGMDVMLMATIENPEWCLEMFTHQLEVTLPLLDMVWDEGYHFDALRWPDDMGFKNSQFFSIQTYQELLKPIHARIIEWAHAKGIPAYLHSCGNIEPFIPELVELGLDALNPIEVKAGLDPLAIKKEFGDKLTLHGGLNTLLWNDIDKLKTVVREQVPVLKQGGGFIFATDHSIPSTVSAQELQEVLELVRELGQY